MNSRNDLTVSDLEKLLAKKKGNLTKLERERDRLASKLNSVQRQIDQINGTKTVTLAVPGSRRMLRAKNKKSLHTHVLELLTENKKGLKLGELNEKILARGYKSKSSNFKNVLYQTLYHSPKVVLNSETHRYGLKDVKTQSSK
ncbi:MAG: hypothetical protein O2955_16675 [Planctomycetota bacterium]|nr:hypothetical protein [Planctomycetota bacterium]MDA1214149.1 hypothetical protein [Planctomycetota bacterium]